LQTKFTGEELISMNLFGMQPDFLEFLEQDFLNFLKFSPTDPKKECLLLDSITNFIKKSKKDIFVIPTDDIPIGITHPGDEIWVRDKLKSGSKTFILNKT